MTAPVYYTVSLVAAANREEDRMATTTKLTEDQIERSVESKVNSADAAFLRGDIKTQEAYDARMKEIDRWAEQARR